MAEPSPNRSVKGNPGGALVPVGTQTEWRWAMATFRGNTEGEGLGGSERALADNQCRALTPFEPV